jgi:hypothetical protein
MYAKPKQGKTTALSLIPNSLLVDTEDGSEFVDAVKVSIDITKSIEEQANQMKDIFRAIWMKGTKDGTQEFVAPYQTLIIDTFTRLDEFSEIVGTLNYMEKAQGKKWNRDAKGNPIPSTSPDFESVHEIGQGFGYKHSREVMVDWYNKICMLSPRTIFVCHVKDKLVANNLGEAVSTREINLTGKLKDIIASKVDTIMYCYRDGNNLMASFSGEDGTRASYLSGKTIVLTESDEEGKIIKDNWNQIFID